MFATLSCILSSCFASRHVPASVGHADLSFRPYPSGAGLNPSEIYLALQRVNEIDPCLVHYDSRSHALEWLCELPSNDELGAALNDRDGLVSTTAVVVLVTTLLERTVVKYSFRGYRFAIMEVGMIPLMLDLSATAEGLGTLHWGGYYDDLVNTLLGLDSVSESVSSCLFIGNRIALRS